MKLLSNVVALFLFSISPINAVLASSNVEPSDLLASHIIANFSPRTPVPEAVPGVSSVSRGQTGRISNWDVSVKYTAVKGEWLLTSYELKYGGRLGKDNLGKTDDGAPTTPTNPNPPGGSANIGDTHANTAQIGDWEYQFHYTYGVREDVLGWHLDSLHVEWKPPVRQVNIPQ